jgi:hypothetical protein
MPADKVGADAAGGGAKRDDLEEPETHGSGRQSRRYNTRRGFSHPLSWMNTGDTTHGKS